MTLINDSAFVEGAGVSMLEGGYLVALLALGWHLIEWFNSQTVTKSSTISFCRDEVASDEVMREDAFGEWRSAGDGETTKTRCGVLVEELAKTKTMMTV